MPVAKINDASEVKVVNKIQTCLEPGELGAMLDLRVWDPKTNQTTKELSKRSESYVQQFLQLMLVQMGMIGATGVANIRDTGNTLRTVKCPRNGNYGTFRCDAAATVVTYGLIIGTGSTAPTITDYHIETIIAHATMNYSLMTFGAAASDATTSQMTLTRNFANVSGGGVTVNEVAAYVMGEDTGEAQRFFMILRDVIAGGILVPNGQTLTVNYRPQAVV